MTDHVIERERYKLRTRELIRAACREIAVLMDKDDARILSGALKKKRIAKRKIKKMPGECIRSGCHNRHAVKRKMCEPCLASARFSNRKRQRKTWALDVTERGPGVTFNLERWRLQRRAAARKGK